MLLSPFINWLNFYYFCYLWYYNDTSTLVWWTDEVRIQVGFSGFLLTFSVSSNKLIWVGSLLCGFCVLLTNKKGSFFIFRSKGRGEKLGREDKWRRKNIRLLLAVVAIIIVKMKFWVPAWPWRKLLLPRNLSRITTKPRWRAFNSAKKGAFFIFVCLCCIFAIS